MVKIWQVLLSWGAFRDYVSQPRCHPKQGFGSCPQTINVCYNLSSTHAAAAVIFAGFVTHGSKFSDAERLVRRVVPLLDQARDRQPL